MRLKCCPDFIKRDITWGPQIPDSRLQILPHTQTDSHMAYNRHEGRNQK